MTYVDGMSGTLADIGQIQATLASLPSASGGGGFDAVLQEVSSISALNSQAGGASQPAGTSTTNLGGSDLSGTYGWPLEEGDALPAGTGSDGPTVASLPGLKTNGPTNVGTYDLRGNWPTSAVEADDLEPVAPADGSLGAGSLGTGLVYTSGVATAGSPASATSAGELGQQAVTQAQTYLGVPYLWGGTNRAQGVDCSGLVQDVYSSLGIDLPRTSQEQALVGQAVPSVADAQPGDLVFFAGSDGTTSSPGHVGIYIGGGQMIDAPYTGTDVRIDPVGDPTAIRRVTGLASSTAPPSVPASASGTLDLSGTDGPSAVNAAFAPAAPPAPGATAGMSSPYQVDFAQAGATYGVPEQLLAAVAATESSDQPDATSSAGAQGLMQLMPSTAASLGVDPFDPSQAVNGAAQLLSSYHTSYGSWSLALAAYNAGPGAVEEYGGIPPYAQTQAYVQNVLTGAGMEGQ
jgi:cell wall-associated NlpC family hydrolase